MSTVGDEVVGAAVVGDALGAPVGDGVVGDTLGDVLGDALGDKVVGEMLGDVLGDVLGDTVVGDALGDALGDAVVGETLGDALPSGGGAEGGWRAQWNTCVAHSGASSKMRLVQSTSPALSVSPSTLTSGFSADESTHSPVKSRVVSTVR